LPELLLDLNDLSLKTVKKRIEYIRENNVKIKDILLEKVNNLEEKALTNNELVFRFLNP